MKLDQFFSLPVESSTKERIKCKFIKGPIPLPWIVKASSVDSKALSVAWVIWLYHGLNKSQLFKLSNKDLSNIDISRQTKSRVLKKLEQAELIKVSRSAGKSPIIEIIYSLEDE